MSCSICIGDIDDEIKTPCNHTFCNSCLTNWLLTNSTCPECRYNIIDERGGWGEQEEEEDEIEIDYVEELTSGLRKSEIQTINNYREQVEDEVYDLLDNLDDDEYMDEMEIDTDDFVMYEFDLIFEEKFKNVLVNVRYDREKRFANIKYDIKYKIKKVKPRNMNKIKKFQKIRNCKKYKLKNF